jgi:regulator of replication initiation timing
MAPDRAPDRAHVVKTIDYAAVLDEVRRLKRRVEVLEGEQASAAREIEALEETQHAAQLEREEINRRLDAFAEQLSVNGLTDP